MGSLPQSSVAITERLIPLLIIQYSSDDIDGGNNEADSSSVGCNPYSFFSRSTACFRLSDALTSNYLNWDGTNHVDCLSDPALTTGLVFESQTLSSQSERPLVPSSIIKRFLISFITKESSQAALIPGSSTGDEAESKKEQFPIPFPIYIFRKA